MGDVLANLEDQINNAKGALAPLVQAEAAALSAAATSTAARVKQEVQVAALTAAHLAAKARLLGSEAVTAVEGEASKVASTVEAGASKAIQWGKSHLAVGVGAAGAAVGALKLGWLAWIPGLGL